PRGRGVGRRRRRDRRGARPLAELRALARGARGGPGARERARRRGAGALPRGPADAAAGGAAARAPGGARPGAGGRRRRARDDGRARRRGASPGRGTEVAVMRKLRAAVLVGLLVKVMVLGLWWQGVTQAAAKAADEKEPPKVTASDSGVTPDLFQKSRGFRDLLEAVHERTAALDERESAVASREATLKALEKTLAAEITRLEGLSKGGPAPPGAPAAAEGVAAVVPTLPKIYASMKPEEAGPILDRLDDATAKGILARMKDRQVGALLAAMNRDRAVALTKALGLPAGR